MISKSIQQLFYSSVLFIILITPSEVLGQSDSLYRESFPDDLYLEQDGITRMLKPAFVIPNNKLHFVLGYSHETSSASDKFENSFGSISSGKSSNLSPYVGVEYQVFRRLSVYAQVMFPKSLQATVSDPYFATKHELSYGTAWRFGTMFSLKRVSRVNIVAGAGIELYGVNMKSTLTSDKNIIPNSLIFVTNAKQNHKLVGAYSTIASEFYVLKNVSIQATMLLQLRSKGVSIKEQQVIRRANVFFGTIDYNMQTFPGFKTGGGTTLLFEVGGRLHLF